MPMQDLETLSKADELKAENELLTRQLSAAHNRHAQQLQLHLGLKAQASACMSLIEDFSLPCMT